MMGEANVLAPARSGSLIQLKPRNEGDAAFWPTILFLGVTLTVLAATPSTSRTFDSTAGDSLNVFCCGFFTLLAFLAAAKKRLTSDERRKRIITMIGLAMVLVIVSTIVAADLEELIPMVPVVTCCSLWLVFGTIVAGASQDSDGDRRRLAISALISAIFITGLSILAYESAGDIANFNDSDYDFFTPPIVVFGSCCFLFATLFGVWTRTGRPLIGWVSASGTISRANAHEEAGRLYDAVILYERVEAWEDVGRVYRLMGDEPNARAALNKAASKMATVRLVPGQSASGSDPPVVGGRTDESIQSGVPSKVDASNHLVAGSELQRVQLHHPPSVMPLHSEVSHISQQTSISAVSQSAASGHAPSQVEPMMAMGSDLSRFERRELLAVGGMAKVHLATDRTAGTTVVWKEAHDQYNPMRISNSKLQDEASLLQQAPHPRLPGFIDHGSIQAPDGSSIGVLVIDHIEGGDLKNTVEQVTKMGMALPTMKVIEIVASICEPLAFLSSLPVPIYHRDLKPQNVIVHPTRGPILIDFGLAKAVATGSDMSVTRGGSGTWTPPERDSGISGPFTDVYSLGKILYYLATSSSPPAILMHDDVKAMVSAGHPQWLADLCLRAAWPKHDLRIASVEAFRTQLLNEGRTTSIASSTVARQASDDYTTWG